MFASSPSNEFCFRLFCQNIQASTRTNRYVPITVYVYRKIGVAGKWLSELSEGSGSNLG